ncbi:hypothetical protein ACJ2A9_05280 [Anaerobacillus sp. MEB173]|uniref:hypothetical protein n=1 Tax=Anaerobacillus sp. MEB173 TaxID=3383345 RepID=UPI003F9202D8
MGINKWQWILPGILMIFIFYSGYQYINESESFSNEDIQNLIVASVEAEQINEQMIEITGKWDWSELPKEGLLGDDYIGVTVFEEDQPMDGERFSESMLVLYHRDKPIYEVEGQAVKNGVVFSFPTKMVEEGIYGNEGEVKLQLQISKNSFSSTKVSMTYLHTWTEHEGLQIEDSRFQSPQFLNVNGDDEVPYWIIERLSTIN